MRRALLVAAFVGCVPALLAGANPWRTLPAVHGGTDPLAQAAHLAHAVRHVPGTDAFWHAPWCHPAPYAQLFLDPMVGPSLVARLVPGAAPAWDYHVALWFTVAGAVLAMAWCARRFGISAGFALAAGVVYAIGPYAAGHFHHLNQVPSPWLPLALGALADLLRATRPTRAAAIFVASFALQLSWSVYATAALALASIVLVVGLGAAPAARRAVIVAGLGVVGVLAVGALPYVMAGREVAGYGREAVETLPFQARWFDAWKASAPRLLPWPAHDPLRPALYPGLGVLVLAAGGLAVTTERRLRRTLAAAVLVGIAFACGRSFLVPFTDIEVPLPYQVLQDLVWPLRALRDPSRFALIASWALVLLAARGAMVLWARNRRVALVVLAVAAVDAAPGPIDAVRVDDDAAVVRVLAELPAGAVWIGIPSACDEPGESARDARFMHWASASGTRLAGGATGFVPPALEELRSATCTTPDRAILRNAGVDWIVTDEIGDGPAHWTDGHWSIVRVEDPSPSGEDR